MASSRFWAAKVLNFRQMAKEIAFYCYSPPAICRHSAPHAAPCGGQKTMAATIKRDGCGTGKPCFAKHARSHGTALGNAPHCEQQALPRHNLPLQQYSGTFGAANYKTCHAPTFTLQQYSGTHGAANCKPRHTPIPCYGSPSKRHRTTSRKPL